MLDKNILETFNLTKKFKLKGKNREILALNNVNLSIKENEIFGLLGPNGAGKTTLIQIITTLIQPTSGYAIVDGINIIEKPNKAKEKIALMLGFFILYNRMTGYDNLKFFCKLYNISNFKEKIYSMAKEFELEKWLNQYVGNYSSGMRGKLALCRTLLLERRFLVLDEPTFGLDVQSRLFIADKLKESNKTILFSSHDLNIVEKVCDRIAFINKGNIIKIGTKKEIKALEQKEIIVELEITQNRNKFINELKQQEFINEVIVSNKNIIVNLNSRDHFQNLFSILSKYKILKIREKEQSLEDLFLKFTK